MVSLQSQNQLFESRLSKLENFLRESDFLKNEVLINLEIKDPKCSAILGEMLSKLVLEKVYSPSSFLISSFYIEPIKYFSS